MKFSCKSDPDLFWKGYFSDFASIFLHQVDTFFAVGSPLGVFLALRNIRIGIGEIQYIYGLKMLLYGCMNIV